MDQEIWKSIEGFEGYYEVSNTGKVRSIDRRIWSEKQQLYINRHGKELKLWRNGGGYFQVNLHKNNEMHVCSISRLVAEAFLPNPDNKPCVDHINRDRTDNRVENLRWATIKENCNNRKDNIPKENLEERIKEYSRRHYAKHKEEANRRSRKWQEENKERMKEVRHNYYMRHRTSTMDHNNLKTKDPDYYKKYYAANKDKIKEWNKSYYERRKASQVL